MQETTQRPTRKGHLFTIALLCSSLLLMCGISFSSVARAQSWIQPVTQAYNGKQYKKVKELLEANKAGNEKKVEWLWRMARAEYDLGNQYPDDDKNNHKHMYAGFDYAKTALEVAPNSSKAHSWYAILIGKIGLIEGTEQKIKNSYKVKEHAMKAIELDPTDDANYHLMGRWHYTLAELSWIERKIASLIYATPPKASFEEAVKYFKEAAKRDPEDIQHYLWEAKSEVKIDRKADAMKTLEMAVKLTPQDEADKRLLKEAKELLAKLN